MGLRMSESVRLLLVEDSDAHVREVARRLEDAGYDVVTQRVATPTELSDELARGGWDAVLCDPSAPALRTPERVDELQRVRDSLAASEARLRQLFEESPAPLWELDLSAVRLHLHDLRGQGERSPEEYLRTHPEAAARCARLARVIDVNRESLRVFPLDGREELPVPLTRLLSEESMPVFHAALVALAAGAPRFEAEIPVRAPAGDVAYLLLRLNVASGHEQTLGRVYVSFLDITERRRAEEESRRDAERLTRVIRIAGHSTTTLQQLMDFALDEVVALSGSRLGYIYYYSEAQRQFTLHAWSRQVMAACSIPNPPTQYELDKTGIWGEAVRQRRPIVVNDFHAPHALKRGYPEGHADLFRFMTVPVFSDGRIVAVAGVANKPTGYTDKDVRQLSLMMDSVWLIAERRVAEENRRELEARMLQSQKLESLGILAGGIAHDFNNLLTVTLAHASLALMKVDAQDPVHHDLQEIATASERAAGLCRQMLAYAGKGPLSTQPVELSSLVDECMSLLAVSLSKKATLRPRLGADLPTIDADPSQIRQVVMNLILNASEAIGEHEGSIEVATGRVEIEPAPGGAGADLGPTGSCLWLEVRDSGCGMDDATQRRIFDPFFTTKFTGRGLGLAAVLGIVRAHHGAITVTSRPGEGACFRLVFPAGHHAVPGPVSPADLEGLAGSGLVLLVDDEEQVRGAAGLMLRHLGYDVLTAEDGYEALRVFRGRSRDIACVLLDLTMPRMDGHETLEALRRVRDDVRVVIASGYSVENVRERFAAHPPAGFLAKPYRVQALGATLREVLA
jgi:signal transduction histidine kinase/DNA-binding response OmpR family regulator